MSEQRQISEFENLYDRLIPKDHILRQISDLVDFSFVIDELKDKYCIDNGRDAEDPIRLFKYLLLKAMARMSDRDLVERSRYDMSYKYFLDYRPEDDVISPSLLTKFRKLRLVDDDILDKLIKITVGIAIDLEILKSKSIIVDSLHSVSRFHNRRPHEVLREEAKKLRKAVYEIDESMREKFPAKMTGDNIDDHIAYCKQLISAVEADERFQIYGKVRTASNYLNEIIEDNLEHLQTSADEEARVGHKTADTEFFGFKTHLAMTEERIITAAVVTSGEKHDGKQLRYLVEKSRAAGVDVEVVIGDGAYSEKDNLEYADGNFELVSKLNPAVVNGVRSKEDEFEFNKDAEMFVCKAGHMAISKKKIHKKTKGAKENPRMEYRFDIEKCKRCPIRDGCYKEGNKTKTYSVTITSDVQIEHKEFQETERFKELSSQRYMIEAKNGELKNRHGYVEADSTGLQAMQIQGAAVIFVANMKRIIKLKDEKR
jgi:transposase